MKNEKKTLSTPLTRACENVLKAHSGELQFHNEDGPVPKKFVIQWAIDVLRDAIAEDENA